ncbi:hypothetical protein BH23THE1_BH23THE1_08850 [soil metagenome]
MYYFKFYALSSRNKETTAQITKGFSRPYKFLNRSFNYGPVSLFDKIYQQTLFYLNGNTFKHIKPNKHNKNRSSHTDLPKQMSL